MNLWTKQRLPELVKAPYPPATPWIGDILGALGWAAGVDQNELPDGAKEAAETYGLERAGANVVVMADGLGLQLLLDHLSYAPTLRKMSSRPVAAQTCSPSTTAAALTSFATGESPGQTRMVGYSVAHAESTMNLLHFAPGIDVRKWQQVPTLLEKFTAAGTDCAVVTDPKFVSSGLTVAAMRGGRFVGAETLSERFSKAALQVAAGTPITYVYWSGIDAAGHAHGPDSEEWRAALEEFDRALGVFLKQVGSRAQILLTADHGMVETGARVDIAEVASLSAGVRLIAGEGRAAHIHALPGHRDAVVERWRDYWQDDAWVFEREQFASVVGPGPGLNLIGDLFVMPKGRKVVVDSRTQTPSSIRMPGVHGSLTANEMLIPVWKLA